MGTNFYMKTKDKKLVEYYAPYDYTITDDPFFCYEIHMGKRSAGWLPCFQAHKPPYGKKGGINSVKEYKEAYNNGMMIFDEYGTRYFWDELFEEDFINWNGGTTKKRKKEKVKKEDKNSPFCDPDMPDWIPISHFEYGNGKYANEFFKDEDGYEFEWGEFN